MAELLSASTVVSVQVNVCDVGAFCTAQNACFLLDISYMLFYTVTSMYTCVCGCFTATDRACLQVFSFTL